MQRFAFSPVFAASTPISPHRLDAPQHLRQPFPDGLRLYWAISSDLLCVVDGKKKLHRKFDLVIGLGKCAGAFLCPSRTALGTNPALAIRGKPDLAYDPPGLL